MQDLDELYGYMWLKPDISNINADIFIDDGEAYVRDNHIPLLFVRNGHNKSVSEFIPISISDSPTILDKSLRININIAIIDQIFKFIIANKVALMDMANGELSAKDFVKKTVISVIKENGLLKDDELMEYARLTKSKTGLNVDIFVDDGGAYKRYGHPLWVYVRNGFTDSDPVFPIKVSRRPSAPQIQYNLNRIDLEAALSFISQNAKLLKLFADEKIEHLDFYKMCKPII